MHEIILETGHMSQIVQHLEAAYPYEGCGILIGRANDNNKQVVEVLTTGNAREQDARHNRYLIPNEEILRGELYAEEKGLEVVGYFHSHPDHPARPSVFDREQAWPWYSYLITSVQQGRATETNSWQLRDDRSAFDQEKLTINGE